MDDPVLDSRDALIDLLREENEGLRSINYRLQEQLKVLEADHRIQAALRAEAFVSRLANGVMTSHNDSYDVRSSRGLRLEVKFSKLNLNDRRRANPTRRWAWAKPFGESGRKEFDNLILIGVKDDAYRHLYLDPGNDFIFFDVPFNEISPLTILTKRYVSIQLTTNPQTAFSSASPLYSQYQVTARDLENRYGSK